MSAALAVAPVDRPPLRLAIASKQSLRPAWQQLRGQIRARGLPIRIASSWVDELPPTAEQLNWNLAWLRSIEETRTADLLLARVGLEEDARVVSVEIGAAIGAGKPVLICGTHPLLERLRGHELVEYGWPADGALQALESHLRDLGRLA